MKPASTADSTSKQRTDTIKVAKGALEAKVEYAAEDSMTFELSGQKLFLYGKGDVKYDDIKLNAAYVELDMKDNKVFAVGKPDSTGKVTDDPVFAQGDQEFKSKTMTYNFSSKKGRITEVFTKEGEGFLHGETVKRDSSNTFYIKNGKYTTCSLEHDPHFYIAAPKIKMIPNDKIVTGPAYLVISDIPTPLALPFGFFPTKAGRSSGVLIPTYGQANNLGFFLKDGGFYWAASDYADLALQADIYTRGSWAAKVSSNYKVRYKFTGTTSFRYSNIRFGRENFPTYSLNKDFFIKWNHSQDPKARPNSRFSADVNAGTSSYNKLNSFNPTDYLSNTFQSSVRYDRSWAGKPFNLSTNLRHSQNTQNRSVDLSVPEVAFTVNRIFPFKREVQVGAPRWYENIGVSYTNNLKNQVNTFETELGDSIDYVLKNRMKNGMQHLIPVSTSLKFLKYFTFNPSFNYSEIWYLQTVRKTYNPTDSSLATSNVNGFSSSRDYNFTTSFTTKVYGMYVFKNKNAPIKAVRHVITPNVGYSYIPGLGKLETGPYGQYGSEGTYSIYEGAVFGSANAIKSSNVNFDIINNLEMKVRSRKDTVTGVKKVKIFENLNFGSSYNLMADSMGWSPVFLNARTQLFENIYINYNSNYDVYALDGNTGFRTKQYQYDATGSPFRFTNATVALNTSFKSKNRTGNSTTTKASAEELERINANRNAYIDFTIPWSLTVNYNYNILRPSFQTKTTQTVTFSGDISLTSKWKFGFSSGYDMTNKKPTYTSLNFYRDLHCWEMAFQVVPFGFRKSYNFTINVKSGALQDLKLTRRRDWQDLR